MCLTSAVFATGSRARMSSDTTDDAGALYSVAPMRLFIDGPPLAPGPHAPATRTTSAKTRHFMRGTLTRPRRGCRRAFCGRVRGMSEDVTLQQLVQLLPPRIWYLTSNGRDMWCRRPYGFLFSTGQIAEAFAKQMGNGEELFAIGVDAGALISDEVLSGLRDNAVTRLFIDPEFDAASGDVHGKILRLAPLT